jgi:hypothetical protein
MLEERYDLVTNSYEFEVKGNHPVLANCVFKHPGNWALLKNESMQE